MSVSEAGGVTDRNRVYGVDFSGAKDAGKRIWIASGVIRGDTLWIEACRRAEGLPGSGKGRDQCLTALRDFIVGSGEGCAFGFDFPFGLPRALIKQERWEDFVLAFADEYPRPRAFRRSCREAAAGRELKRVTDVESQTPLSPYNLRLYRQTYYGIRDLLGPLVEDQLACVLPMQTALRGLPWMVEICPASTLRPEGLYVSYKGRAEGRHAARKRILEALEGKEALGIQKHAARSAAVENHGGDALDSIIAAFATFRALCAPAFPTVESGEAYALEGYVYV